MLLELPPSCFRSKLRACLSACLALRLVAWHVTALVAANIMSVKSQSCLPGCAFRLSDRHCSICAVQHVTQVLQHTMSLFAQRPSASSLNFAAVAMPDSFPGQTASSCPNSICPGCVTMPMTYAQNSADIMYGQDYRTVSNAFSDSGPCLVMTYAQCSLPTCLPTGFLPMAGQSPPPPTRVWGSN